MCAVLTLHVQTQNVCEPVTEEVADTLAEEDEAVEAEVEAAVTEATEEPVVEAQIAEDVSAEEETAAFSEGNLLPLSVSDTASFPSFLSLFLAFLLRCLYLVLWVQHMCVCVCE